MTTFIVTIDNANVLQSVMQILSDHGVILELACPYAGKEQIPGDNLDKFNKMALRAAHSRDVSRALIEMVDFCWIADQVTDDLLPEGISIDDVKYLVSQAKLYGIGTGVNILEKAIFKLN